MKVTTLPPLKNCVTRVTRVTKIINQLKSLVFFQVTRSDSGPHTSCNAASACNGHRSTSTLLVRTSDCAPRWIDAPLSGRGAA
jgi:hypothetical protein